MGGDRRSDRIETQRDVSAGSHSPRAGHDAAGDTGAPGRQSRRTFLLHPRCGAFSIAATSHLKKVRACRGAAARARFESSARDWFAHQLEFELLGGFVLHRRNRRFHSNLSRKSGRCRRGRTPARRRSTWPLQDGHARRRPAPSRPRGAEGLRSGRSTPLHSRTGSSNASFRHSRKATSSLWTISRATRGRGVEQLIKAAGAESRYLPQYSPDMNPIEKA